MRHIICTYPGSPHYYKNQSNTYVLNVRTYVCKYVSTYASQFVGSQPISAHVEGNCEFQSVEGRGSNVLLCPVTCDIFVFIFLMLQMTNALTYVPRTWLLFVGHLRIL